MAKREKLLARMRNNPTNVRFEELDNLLQWYGFERRPRGGSHYYYKREGCRPISIPRRRPVKTVYVRRAIALLEECEQLAER